ncbi:MAG TPA: division/cell wall cluster transcriptional repressor MraZ [Candidatus Dormibacteraeota bacterium]|nr:division/cell wall cluster transcriptional repressor MraZ [Candidatus Dormibacteraeota bacterium]
MLRGSQSATVDAKGRLKIPAIFFPEVRKLGDDFYVTSDDGSFAYVYPMKVWQEKEEKLSKVASHNPTVQKYLDLTSYYGQQQTADAQGRILVPARLREVAQLTGEVEVLGKLTSLAVWNSSRFFEQKVRAHPWTEEDAKILGDLGI